MMKLLTKLTLLMAMLSFSGCLFVDVRYPMDRDYEKTTLGSKIGRSEMQSILWLIAWGNAGTDAAAQNGDIQTIHHADSEVFTVLFGLYSRVTTVLYGD